MDSIYVIVVVLIVNLYVNCQFKYNLVQIQNTKFRNMGSNQPCVKLMLNRTVSFLVSFLVSSPTFPSTTNQHHIIDGLIPD